MTEIESNNIPEVLPDQSRRNPPQFTVNQLIWALITAATFVYLLVLPIRIQYWETNFFTNTVQELRRWEPVRHIWGYQIRHLPVLGSELLVQVIFSLSLVIVLAAFFYALWLVLNQVPEDDRPEAVDVA
jgi:hypothetical protein